MPNLIPLHRHPIGPDTIQTVNAQDIYAFLEVKSRFDKWIERRIATYGFQEGRDFATVNSDQGPVRTIEYHVSLDMAKELSMVEKTPKGKEARQYFLECERQTLGAAPPIGRVTQAQVSLQIAKALVEIEQRQDAIEARQDVQEATLTALQERQPPEGRLTVRQFRAKYSKPYLPKEVLDAFSWHCRQQEQPIMFRPDGFDYASPYYTLDTLNAAYQDATRQLTFLPASKVGRRA